MDLDGYTEGFSSMFGSLAGSIDPQQMLAHAYDSANKSAHNLQNPRFLNQYHKCLFALIKVLTKRMKLFYQGKYHKGYGKKGEHEAMEAQFQKILAKILSKMKQIEEEANAQVGRESA